MLEALSKIFFNEPKYNMDNFYSLKTKKYIHRNVKINQILNRINEENIAQTFVLPPSPKPNYKTNSLVLKIVNSVVVKQNVKMYYEHHC